MCIFPLNIYVVDTYFHLSSFGTFYKCKFNTFYGFRTYISVAIFDFFAEQCAFFPSFAMLWLILSNDFSTGIAPLPSDSPMFFPFYRNVSGLPRLMNKEGGRISGRNGHILKFVIFCRNLIKNQEYLLQGEDLAKEVKRW